jgi:hypothetical protein
MREEKVITEYNENEEIPFIDDEEKNEKNPEFSTEEEKTYIDDETFKSNVRVIITEPKGNENINKDYI